MRARSQKGDWPFGGGDGGAGAGGRGVRGVCVANTCCSSAGVAKCS